MILIMFLIILVICIIIKIYYSHCTKNLYSNISNIRQDKINLFKLSDNKKITKISNEIFIIDNFYKNPDKIRKLAISKQNSFKDHNTLYKTQYYNPNMYYNLHYDLIQFLENLCNVTILSKEWNENVVEKSNGFFQYITKNSNPILHMDEDWGIVLFLTPNAPKNTGTSFYRHKRSGIRKHMNQKELEKIYSDEELKVLEEYSKTDFWEEGEKPQFDKWEKIYECDNVYNRALIFDGRQYHCSSGGFGDNIENCRLFQTFFFSKLV